VIPLVATPIDLLADPDGIAAPIEQGKKRIAAGHPGAWVKALITENGIKELSTAPFLKIPLMIAPHLMAVMDQIMSGIVKTLPNSRLYMLSHLLESPDSPLYTLLQQQGAYLLRNPHGCIIYVGITIRQTLAHRVWYHANGESDEMQRFYNLYRMTPTERRSVMQWHFFQVIAIPELWLRLAIEQYAIERFNPIVNINGKQVQRRMAIDPYVILN
jgi:hypothetical protein